MFTALPSSLRVQLACRLCAQTRISTHRSRVLHQARPSTLMSAQGPSKRPRPTPAQASASHGLTRHEPFKVAGLVCTSFYLEVPLDYTEQSGRNITLFARELVAAERAEGPPLPYLLFLQGGPGFECQRPLGAEGWIKAATEEVTQIAFTPEQKYAVLLMDQRGTGLSTPITAANFGQQGTPEQQAAYLVHFRLENIVRDAERLRLALAAEPRRDGVIDKFVLLGQSYGGFCAVHYLSAAPQGLQEVMLTGGLPPCINPEAREAIPIRVYEHTFRRVIEQNKRFYQRFPGDEALARNIAAHLLDKGGVRLPGGSLLTARGFQTLGLSCLGGLWGFERLHYLLEGAFDGSELSYAFLKGVEAQLPWGTNPLYAALHEAIYCQGRASKWAAERVRCTGHLSNAFDAAWSVKNGERLLFTGEMVFPWQFDEVAELQPFKEAAEILAGKADWPRLYDLKALSKNTVPVASATYYEDMYVDFDLAQETARCIKGIRQWVTNEFYHSGIRNDGARIFERLSALLHNPELPG